MCLFRLGYHTIQLSVNHMLIVDYWISDYWLYCQMWIVLISIPASLSNYICLGMTKTILLNALVLCCRKSPNTCNSSLFLHSWNLTAHQDKFGSWHFSFLSLNLYLSAGMIIFSSFIYYKKTPYFPICIHKVILGLC